MRCEADISPRIRMFSEFMSVFFWGYKRMDNVNYNYEILAKLCDAKKAASGSAYFNKPICLQMLSIVECILYDFIRRVSEHSREQIPNLDQNLIKKTKLKKLEDINKIVEHMQKHGYLDVSQNKTLYADWKKLRTLRNRIHIQNRHATGDADENKLWTDTNVKLAGRFLEEIVSVLVLKHPRPGSTTTTMAEFPKPWNI
jgi:hypothetical protein